MKIQEHHLLPGDCWSSREGARVHLAVLHTVEGDVSLESLARIFESGRVSSHFASDKDGKIARYVLDANKAWTQCNFNPVSLSLEQAGYASWSTKNWFTRHDQLEAAANFILYTYNHHGVPIRKGKVSGGGVTRDGVVQHKDLGLIGCGHSDCGAGYPQGYVELLARYWLARQHGNRRNIKKLGKRLNRTRKRHGVKPVPTEL